MFKVHIWLEKREGMTAEEFRDYWLQKHAPIARDGYEKLKGYTALAVTGAPRGQGLRYDGVAELWWDSREDFAADMKSDAARAATADLEKFTSGFGLMFVEEHEVK